MDEETLKKYEAFRAETTELRKEMTVTRAQMRALMSGDNPDEAKAGDLAAQLFDMRTQMQAKADVAGLQGFGPGFGRGCNGPGGGPGYGRGCDGPGDCFRGKGGRR
jgi:zinc resistance-associated protein